MTSVISWGDRENNNRGNRSGADFLRLKPDPGVYTIRCLGKPVRFYRYYIDQPENSERNFESAITENPEDCVIRNVYNIEPSVRYAINVIDRADDKVKILEMPKTIFNQISEWADANEASPGGEEGCDFRIKVDRKTKNPRDTKYIVSPMKPTPFSDEERELLNNKGQGLHPLMEIFKPTPQDQIEYALGLKASQSEDNSSEHSEAVGASESSSDAEDDEFSF